MNILDLLKKQIKTEGKDGLVNCELDCGCRLNYLAPCSEIRDDCELAEEDRETAESMGIDFFMRACLPNAADHRAASAPVQPMVGCDS